MSLSSGSIDVSTKCPSNGAGDKLEQNDIENPAIDIICSEEGDDGTIHPLSVPLVVERIMQFLPLGALKETRLVSRLWHDLSLEPMEEEAWVNIGFDENGKEGLAAFLQFLEENFPSPQHVFFRNFRLKYLNVGSEIQSKSRLPEFWATYGHCLHTLLLKRCCVGKRHFLRLISSQTTPNLKKLLVEECPFVDNPPAPDTTDSEEEVSGNQIRTLVFQSDKSRHALPFKLSNIWTIFPSLIDLCLTDLTEVESTEILEAAVDWRKSHKKPLQLTKLNVFGEEKYSMRKIPDRNFDLLRMSGFRLTSLQLDLGECVEEAQFATLLRTFSSTLETLIIWRGLLASKVNGFPYGTLMPRLRRLEAPDSCLMDMTFIRYMKALQRLSVLQCDMEPIAYETDILHNMEALGTEGGELELDPCPTLLYLRVEFKMSEAEIVFLRRIFPKLLQFTAFFGPDFCTRYY